MKLLAAIGVWLVFVSAAAASEPLSLDDVVARYEKAIGGREALQAIQSLTFLKQMPNGRARKMIKMRPYYFLVGCKEPSCAIAEGFDGTAWEAQPSHQRVIRARLEAAKSLRRASEFDEPLIGWREKGHSAKLVGREQFQGKDAYRIDMTLNDGLEVSNYIDTHTFLLVGKHGRVPMHSRGEHYETIGVYEDYRPVAGVLYAHRIRTIDVKTGAEVDTQSGWDSIESNLPYDTSYFAPPQFTAGRLTSLVEYLLTISGSVEPSEQWFRPYRAFRLDPQNSKVNSEDDLNWLGYELLKQNAVDDALVVFQALVAEYPSSSNAFDSYGDALYQSGKKQEAIAAFTRSLELNPKAAATKAKLDELKTTGRIAAHY